ncbi:MAG: winged helix DNA-binding domain-containing protein, partial [Truepera sp.]|nr:winged helix DNA-binding domain-containing protein [Truepera sp.]
LRPQVRFLAPLDQLLWDRKAALHLFDFDYVWEVYKPEQDRKWGYYALPVMYGERFVARVDSRLEGSTWQIKGWWWEKGVDMDPEMLEGLEQAVVAFMRYLLADEVKVAPSLDRRVQSALQAAKQAV